MYFSDIATNSKFATPSSLSFITFDSTSGTLCTISLDPKRSTPDSLIPLTTMSTQVSRKQSNAYKKRLTSIKHKL